MNKKSILISQIQQLSGVEGVELIMVEPCEDNYALVHIYFDPKSIVNRLTPEEVSQRNYAATEKRGLINNTTTFVDFRHKLLEEVHELTVSWNSNKFIDCGGEFDPSELADVSLVCDAMAIHYGIDLQAEKEKKMRYNEKRLD